jgi:hypothetical protein
MPKVKPHLIVCDAVPPLPKFGIKYMKPYSSPATTPLFNLQGPLPPLEEALYTEPGTYRQWKSIYWLIGACHHDYIVDIFLQFYLMMKNPSSYPVSVEHCKLKPYTPPTMSYEYSSLMNTYIWAYYKTNLNYAYTIAIFYAKMVLMLAMKLLAPYLTPFITAIYLLTTFTQSAWMFYKPYNRTILLNFSTLPHNARKFYKSHNCTFLLNSSVLHLSIIAKQLTKFVNLCITLNKSVIFQLFRHVQTLQQLNLLSNIANCLLDPYSSLLSIIKPFTAPTTPGGPRGQRLLLSTVCESLFGRRVGLFVAAGTYVGFNKQLAMLERRLDCCSV